MTLLLAIRDRFASFYSVLLALFFNLTSRFSDKLSHLKEPYWLPKETGNIIVTGATSGLGFETAKYLAKFGHRIIMTGRDEAKGKAAVQRIKDETGNNRVELYLVNFASFQSVREFAGKIDQLDIPIHLLVNNAAILKMDRLITHDGLETMFQVNHASVQFLTTLLLDRIKMAQPSGRIVTLSSGAHWFGTLDLNNLQDKSAGFKPMVQYGRTKLANIIFGKELQRRLNKEGRKDILSVMVHPNFVVSGLTREAGSGRQAFNSWIGLPPNIGARCQIWASLAPPKDLIPGAYYVGCRQLPVRSQAEDRKVAQRLWEITEKLYASSG